MSVFGLHLTPIGDGAMLLEPSLALDVGDSGAMLEGVVRHLQRTGATRLYYDLEQLAIIEPLYYNWLNMLARACRTVNVKMICIHMQPTAAFALSCYMEQPPDFGTGMEVEGWNKGSK
jgi:rsbT antagonist protein RsbS